MLHSLGGISGECLRLSADLEAVSCGVIRITSMAISTEGRTLATWSLFRAGRSIGARYNTGGSGFWSGATDRYARARRSSIRALADS